MRRRLLLVVIALIAVIGLMYFFDPMKYWFAPKCPFKLLTGLSCPGCGMQRFLNALLTGHPAQAIRYNYYLAYALPYAMLFVVEWVMPQGTKRDKLVAVIENKYVVWFYIITFFIWIVVRNILHI